MRVWAGTAGKSRLVRSRSQPSRQISATRKECIIVNAINPNRRGQPSRLRSLCRENILFTAPSTESQKEIWSSVQMGNDANCAYNESISLALKGDLDLAALRQAPCYLIRRHEALRTLFGPDGKTLCVTAAPDSIEGPLIDLSGLSRSRPKKSTGRATCKGRGNAV